MDSDHVPLWFVLSIPTFCAEAYDEFFKDTKEVDSALFEKTLQALYHNHHIINVTVLFKNKTAP